MIRATAEYFYSYIVFCLSVFRPQLVSVIDHSPDHLEYITVCINASVYAVDHWNNLDTNKSCHEKNKRSMDLGALLDTCNWCDKWQISTDLFVCMYVCLFRYMSYNTKR